MYVHIHIFIYNFLYRTNQEKNNGLKNKQISQDKRNPKLIVGPTVPFFYRCRLSLSIRPTHVLVGQATWDPTWGIFLPFRIF